MMALGRGVDRLDDLRVEPFSQQVPKAGEYRVAGQRVRLFCTGLFGRGRLLQGSAYGASAIRLTIMLGSCWLS